MHDQPHLTTSTLQAVLHAYSQICNTASIPSTLVHLPEKWADPGRCKPLNTIYGAWAAVANPPLMALGFYHRRADAGRVVGGGTLRLEERHSACVDAGCWN